MYAEELKKKNLTKEKQGTKSYLKNGFVVVERVLAFREKKKRPFPCGYCDVPQLAQLKAQPKQVPCAFVCMLLYSQHRMLLAVEPLQERKRI